MQGVMTSLNGDNSAVEDILRGLASQVELKKALNRNKV